MEVVLVYVNAPTAQEARRIGRALVDARLAAAVNLVPGLSSIYRWQGEVRERGEVMLVVKTRADRVEAVADMVRSLHSYECPAVLAVPVRGGDGAYLDWICAETG